MKKREIKKLQLNRETLAQLESVKGGARQGGVDGTHYEGICKDLCNDGNG
jgi:hypothetical protein